MNNKAGKYNHLNSYKDIQREKMHMDYKARLHQKELEIRFVQLGYDLHPVRLIPSLLSEWATPLMLGIRNRFLDLILSLISMKEDKKQ